MVKGVNDTCKVFKISQHMVSGLCMVAIIFLIHDVNSEREKKDRAYSIRAITGSEPGTEGGFMSQKRLEVFHC